MNYRTSQLSAGAGQLDKIRICGRRETMRRERINLFYKIQIVPTLIKKLEITVRFYRYAKIKDKIL